MEFSFSVCISECIGFVDQLSHNYCNSRNLTQSYILEPPEIVPFSFGSAPINQGETAAIMCNIKRGDLPVSITWSLMGKVVSSDPDMTTSMIGSQISLLNIKHVDYRHSGVFTCRATNSAGSVTHSAQLKVNG